MTHLACDICTGYMAIWVSKDPSGPQECRSRTLNNFGICSTNQNFKILTFKIFLCIFQNFLCIMYEAWAKWICIKKHFYSHFLHLWGPYFYKMKLNIFSPELLSVLDYSTTQKHKDLLHRTDVHIALSTYIMQRKFWKKS